MLLTIILLTAYYYTAMIIPPPDLTPGLLAQTGHQVLPKPTPIIFSLNKYISLEDQPMPPSTAKPHTAPSSHMQPNRTPNSLQTTQLHYAHNLPCNNLIPHPQQISPWVNTKLTDPIYALKTALRGTEKEQLAALSFETLCFTLS